MTRSEADQDGVVPDDDDLTLSWHARRRIGELGFAVRDVVDCVRQPEQNYGSHPAYGPDRRTYQRGDLAVVLHELTTKVVRSVALVQPLGARPRSQGGGRASTCTAIGRSRTAAAPSMCSRPSAYQEGVSSTRLPPDIRPSCRHVFDDTRGNLIHLVAEKPATT